MPDAPLRSTRCVALLRGVNVGKGQRVAMAAFKHLLEGLGCTGVKTLLNSGNAVFGTAARPVEDLASAIATQLQAQFGVTTPVIVKTAADWAVIVDQAPMAPPAADHPRFLVTVGPNPQAVQALAPLVSLAQAPEQFIVTDQAAYLHCPEGVLASPVGEALMGPAGRAVTTRNWATVLKIQALLQAA